MAHLAVVGSCSVNGVSEIHTKLLRERVLTHFAEFWPEKFNNKTNGVTPRRWLLKANPKLAGLITEAIGEGCGPCLGEAVRGGSDHALDSHRTQSHAAKFIGLGQRIERPL